MVDSLLVSKKERGVKEWWTAVNVPIMQTITFTLINTTRRTAVWKLKRGASATGHCVHRLCIFISPIAAQQKNKPENSHQMSHSENSFSAFSNWDPWCLTTWTQHMYATSLAVSLLVFCQNFNQYSKNSIEKVPKKNMSWSLIYKLYIYLRLRQTNCTCVYWICMAWSCTWSDAKPWVYQIHIGGVGWLAYMVVLMGTPHSHGQWR